MRVRGVMLCALLGAASAYAGSPNDVGLLAESGPALAGPVFQPDATTACPPGGAVAGAFTGTFTQLGRIFRDGIASACPGKAYPGGFNPGTTYNYETYTYRNTSGASACVTVNFDPNTGATPCGTNAHASAYTGSYDPANQGTNFVGDVGSSVTQPFAFDVPASTDLVLAVTNTASAAICTFAFEVVNLPCSNFAKGDFNSDGAPDLLFRNVGNPAQNKVWFMDGVTRTAEATISPDASSANQKIRGADDFNADSLNDLVFWNETTGAVEFWLMNGTTRVGAPLPLTGGPTLPVNWDLSATADFNNDNLPDVVWRNFTSQKIVIWTMNGAAKVGNIIPTPDQALDGNWIIVAAADYTNDGNTDFLWYNFTSGKIVTWYMDASVVRTTGQFTTPANAGDSNWKVVASSDYSAAYVPGTPPTGSPDIVWRNETSGNQVVWHLDFNSTRVHGQFTNPTANTPALDWVIVGPR